MQHITAVSILCALCCAGAAVAGNQSDHRTSGSLYATTFFSLKQGHNLGPAQLRLSDNSTLELIIPDETLTGQKGTFHIDGFVFTAATEFSNGKARPHRYTLTFKGLALLNAYIAGTARLREYIHGDRFIQEVLFLFAGSTKSADSDQGDSLLPF